VAAIRAGTASGYWQADSGFGPLAWPDTPFLGLGDAELARLDKLPAAVQDPWLRALPILRHGNPPGIPKTKLQIEVAHGSAAQETLEALAALLEAHRLCQPGRTLVKIGRNAPRRAPLEAQMRGIVLTRLRAHFSAAETMILLEDTGWAGIYCDESSLDCAWRKAKRARAAFSLLARDAINAGQWFFPFCNAFLVV
jgi:hypothetical protein